MAIQLGFNDETWSVQSIPYPTLSEETGSLVNTLLPHTHTEVLTSIEPMDEMSYNLEQLLQELYLDDERAADFSRQDLTQLAHLIGKLLRYRPSTRSTAAEILSAT